VSAQAGAVIDEQTKPACDCGAPVGFEGFHAVWCASNCHAEPAFINASDLVWFDGDICMWGDLLVQDRKAYMSGGYPF
jgi:hypothetical protein